jgi:hypothetical protein
VVSANRLKDARAHLGQDVPVECVDTVQDLKKLVEYAETNRSETHALAQTHCLGLFMMSRNDPGALCCCLLGGLVKASLAISVKPCGPACCAACQQARSVEIKHVN